MINFIKSASKPTDFFNDETPEICLMGRSNVGKSSLINALANNQVSKTSSTPGRTQLVNYFDAQNFRIVDLPGYGYANLSKAKINEIKKMTDEYLHLSNNLLAIFHICDANVIMEKDLSMAKYLKQQSKNYFLVLNKIDKQKMYWYKNNLNKYAEMFKLPPSQIILVSAKDKTNINELFSLMKKSIK